MNVGYLITRAARQFAERTAIISGDRRLTFAEVDQNSNRLANSLIRLGLRPGDRVGIITHNCPEYVEIEFALSKGGFVAVPLNSRLATADHLFMLKDAGVSVLILGDGFSQWFAGREADMAGICRVIALGQPAPGQIPYGELLADGLPEDPPTLQTLNLSDMHNIMYTSGTSGRPKGVIHTHRVKWTVTINLLTDMGPISRDDRILHVAPLTHGTGFFVLPWFVRGAASVILPEFNPRRVCETIQRERVTTFKLVPTILMRLLDFPDLDRYDLSSLHTIIYGASPMPVDRLREALRRFGPILIQVYGQTEALVSICTLGKADHVVDGTPAQARRLASAGHPFSNVAVRVVDEWGRDLPPGEIGEVVVHGDHVMSGYWNLPGETAEVLKDGWVYTRDLGTMDEQGYVYLVDRKSDMIISGGFNIYPREVEEVLHTHPDVQEAAVFGVPDPQWGEAVKAAVVRRPGATVTVADLMAFCAERMARFKRPKSVDFLDELPKNAYGKIEKKRLREPYWQGYERRIN